MIGDIGKITVFLLLLLAVFLLTTKSKNRSANYFFAIFLLIISFDLSAIFLRKVYSNYPFLEHFRNASAYLQMPLLYFYVKKTCFTNYPLGWKQLWHALPFVGFYILLLSTEVTREIDILNIVTTQLQYAAYFVAIFMTLLRFRQIRLANYSVHSGVYKWLRNTTILYLIANCLVLLRLVLNEQRLELLNLIIFAFALIIICWFVIKTMRTPYLFSGVDLDITTTPASSDPQETETYDQEIADLSSYMSTQKPYLDNSLTLQDLAQQTNSSERQLSFLINKVLGQHFYDYINSYRIEEACRLLLQNDLNIQQIMYEVGFNSKSSFNTAFKKNTGQTPSQFRTAARNSTKD